MRSGQTRPHVIDNAAASQAYTWSTVRRSLIIFVCAAGLLGGVALTHYYVSMNAERVGRETRELLNVALGKTAIENNLQSVTSDLMFLAKRYELLGVLENGNRELRATVAREFLTFSEQKRVYDQIRLLDPSGREIVRVNYNKGNPAIVPDEQLQNKAGRYYFKITWSMARDQVYISPLDLNIEHGRIEQPRKPMIRLATPVFDRTKHKLGVLVLNYLGDTLIDDFNTAAANISDHVMLLNSDGFWLSSVQSDDEWGFMYGNGRTFGKAHPGAWSRIQAEESGQFRDEDGMFSFTTVYPLRSAAGFHRMPAKAPVVDNYYWKAVSQVSPQLLAAARNEFFRRHLLLYAGMLVLLAFASILLARAGVRNRQATLQVEIEQRFRERLEAMVEQRTRELKDAQIEKGRVIEQLIQAEKMAAIGTMASGIGHEINNPLYAILTKAEAIRDGGHVSRSRSYSEDIVQYAKDIAKIVKDFSGYARPGSEHDLEVVDVNDELSEAVSMAKQSLVSEHIEIRKDLDPVPGILGKSEEIRQAFFNVIRNGIQATNGKGSMEVTSRVHNDEVSIRIHDTGPGISKEDKSRIFDPFFTTKGPDEGEGLGLYIVRQIVRKYSGEIEVESQAGTGTVFRIRFPARAPS